MAWVPGGEVPGLGRTVSSGLGSLPLHSPPPPLESLSGSSPDLDHHSLRKAHAAPRREGRNPASVGKAKGLRTAHIH